MPGSPDQPPIPDADKALILHIELAILGGHVLMGTDASESMGFTLTEGNNVHINLEPDTRAETDRLFHALSTGGKVDMPLMEMFWGDYFGAVTDCFGLHWMFNCSRESSGGNLGRPIRPTALAEPDLQRYTIRLPARGIGSVDGVNE